MIGVFQVKAQSAFYVIVSASKPDQTNLVLESLLQSCVQQQEVSTRNIVFQTQRGDKLELVIAYNRAAPNQLVILVDLEPGSVDHGEVFEQTTDPWIRCSSVPDRNIASQLDGFFDIRNGFLAGEDQPILFCFAQTAFIVLAIVIVARFKICFETFLLQGHVATWFRNSDRFEAHGPGWIS